MWLIYNVLIYKVGKDIQLFCGKKKNQLYKVNISVKYWYRNENMLRNKIIVCYELQVRYLELQCQGIIMC